MVFLEWMIIILTTNTASVRDNGMSVLKKIKNEIVQFLCNEEGLTTVEYAVAGTLIGLAVVAAFTQLGNAVGNSINAAGSPTENLSRR